MARGIDQRLRLAHNFDHAWPATRYEAEFYTGLRTILLQQRYAANVLEPYAGDVAIVLCSLALTTERPDRTLAKLLARVERPSALGGLPRTMALELRDHLGAIDARPFNDILDGIQEGPVQVMSRVEYYDLFEHLKSLQKVGNTVLHEPAFFIERDTNWATVSNWMSAFGLTRIWASDGMVGQIGQAVARTTLSELLEESFRVLT